MTSHFLRRRRFTLDGGKSSSDPPLKDRTIGSEVVVTTIRGLPSCDYFDHSHTSSLRSTDRGTVTRHNSRGFKKVHHRTFFNGCQQVHPVQEQSSWNHRSDKTTPGLAAELEGQLYHSTVKEVSVLGFKEC
ncbi:hypothetical protein Bbelb_264340 [Branchiostoma belcheri]|nr:hypothetical protein Bbelb_264340 [Branchiostoma belcheri]